MKSKLTNAFIFALAILGGLFIFLAVVAFMVGEDEPTVSQPVKQDTEIRVAPQPIQTKNTSDTVGPEAEQAFLSGCGYDAQCQCMFNYLDANLTNSEFWALTSVSEEELFNNPQAIKAITSCI